MIANAYDADAKAVYINLYDNAQGKKIEVIDDGIGMDFDEINTKFLRIGRNRRADGAEQSPSGRKATGKKGLGKLALFGIGDVIEVSTGKEGTEQLTHFELNWTTLKASAGGEYKPQFQTKKISTKYQGTSIVLTNLKRETPFDKEGLAISISKLFNCFDANFKCYVSLNNDEAIEVNNDLKFKNIEPQFSWDFPAYAVAQEDAYAYKAEIIGKIISTEKPLRPGLRGVTLYANGRMVNAPEFFGVPESSHGFSYLAGWLSVNFVDNTQEDVISTNRQSINWELPEMTMLREFLANTLRRLVRDWSAKRKAASRKAITDTVNIDTAKWIGTLSGSVKEGVENLVEAIVSEAEVSSENQLNVIKIVHTLIPEYPLFHWRSLHEQVQGVSKEFYETANYYTAVLEAIKRYAGATRKASGSTQKNDTSMMQESYSIGANKLNVTRKYMKPDGSDFHADTHSNIREGHHKFSESIVMAVRNPLSHEEIDDLRTSGLFSEKDCLDALGLISYLYRRLDDAIEFKAAEAAIAAAAAAAAAAPKP